MPGFIRKFPKADLGHALGQPPRVFMANLKPKFLAVIEAHPTTSGVLGFGLGFKLKRGRFSGTPTLTFFVEQKLPRARVPKGQFLPSKVETLKTDVIETGPISPLSDLTGVSRPVRGGYSIGHVSGDTGTAGCWAYEEAAGQTLDYVLSNNHVLANYNAAKPGDAIIQPGLLDWGSAKNTIGTLARSVDLHLHDPLVPRVNMTPNYVDAALCKVQSDGVSPVIAGVGNAPSWRKKDDVAVGLEVKKTGRSTGTTYSTVGYVGVTLYISFGWRGNARFDNQIALDYMSRSGDSGSLILAEVDNSAVGLCFAGSLSYTFANPIEDVQTALGVQVAREVWTA